MNMGMGLEAALEAAQKDSEIRPKFFLENVFHRHQLGQMQGPDSPGACRRQGVRTQPWTIHLSSGWRTADPAEEDPPGGQEGS